MLVKGLDAKMGVDHVIMWLVSLTGDRPGQWSHRFPTIQLQLELTYSDLLFNI